MLKKPMIMIITFLFFLCSAVSASEETNLYRNKDYTFSIRFPDGWNIRNGQTPHSVVVAGNRKSELIIIQVWQLPKKITLEDFTENDLKIHLKETFEEVKGRYSNAALHASGITYISNVKATWLAFTYTIKLSDATAHVKTIMYQVFYNGRMYQIMCSSSVERYKQFENTFLTTVLSFVFDEASSPMK